MTKRTIVEDLNWAADEPSQIAAQQAQKLKLKHVGFGRYADDTDQVTHVAHNDKLVPFKNAIKSTDYRKTRSADYETLFSQMSPAVEEAHAILADAHSPEVYDADEIDVIQQFISGSYAEINEHLAKLPAGIAANKIQPTGPDDVIPEMIELLDSAMKRSRSPIEFIGYTKVDIDTEIKSGFKFRSYRSLSINLANVITPDEETPVVLQIRVKKNTRGLYAANFSEMPEETEFILPRGATIEVISGPTPLVGTDSELGGANRQIIYYDCTVKT